VIYLRTRLAALDDGERAAYLAASMQPLRPVLAALAASVRARLRRGTR
jgi:hypothetical protein